MRLTLDKRNQVALVLLDLPFAAQALQGVMMEIEDSRFPLVKSVEVTTQVAEAARDLDYCVRPKGRKTKQRTPLRLGVAGSP